MEIFIFVFLKLLQDEYAQKTNPAFTPLSITDELKKEVKLTLKNPSDTCLLHYYLQLWCISFKCSVLSFLSILEFEDLYTCMC